jgi:hypothetical protein
MTSYLKMYTFFFIYYSGTIMVNRRGSVETFVLNETLIYQDNYLVGNLKATNELTIKIR